MGNLCFDTKKMSLLLRTLLFAAVVLIGMVDCTNILLVPLNIPSHVIMNMHIGKQLVSKGHAVTVVLPEGYLKARENLSNLTVETYKLEGGIDIREEKWSTDGIRMALQGSLLETFNYTFAQVEGFKATCESLIKDEMFVTKLKKKRFDIALAEITSCTGFLPYKLNVPYSLISFGCYQPRWPHIYSYLPYFTTTFTDEMTFFQRLQNYILFSLTELMLEFDKDDGITRKYVKGKEPLSIAETNIKADVTFILREHVTDFPRPLPSNAFYIGQILGQPSNPLQEPELKSFVDQAPDGIVVVSFGSWLHKLPIEILDIFMKAFRVLKLRIVMRHGGRLTTNVPDNVKMVSWLPQNDLLGHPKTRLLIFHGGANSMQEVAYHGVPSIAIPLLLDQSHNAAIIKSKKYGDTLDIRELTTRKLVETINNVLNNQEITENVKKVKEIMQNRKQSGLDVLDYWIDYLVKFGGEYLRSKAKLEMPLYAYYCHDVKLFLLSIVLLSLYVTYRIIYLICCRKSNKKKQE